EPHRPPETPPLPRLASRHEGSRPADRRLLRPASCRVERRGSGLVRGAAGGAGRRHHGLGDRNAARSRALGRRDDAAVEAGRLYQISGV
ncbi:MAG: Succinate dehydrogenase flavin-adding protein, antitoxin of CptAB toxin-antitoxin, partial [uncultured Sphingosinicella sp.]